MEIENHSAAGPRLVAGKTTVKTWQFFRHAPPVQQYIWAICLLRDRMKGAYSVSTLYIYIISLIFYFTNLCKCMPAGAGLWLARSVGSTAWTTLQHLQVHWVVVELRSEECCCGTLPIRSQSSRSGPRRLHWLHQRVCQVNVSTSMSCWREFSKCL